MGMNIVKNIAENTAKLGSKMLFKVKKASPELLLAGGVVCIIGGTVMACKATKKATKVLEEHNQNLDDIQEREELSNDPDEELELYTDSEKKHDKIRVYTHTAGELVKTYAPSIAVIGLGVALIFTSHGIMRKRNATLIAAYNVLDASFRKYRGRVVEEYGKEKDKEFCLGARKQDVNYIEMDEDGNGRQVKDKGYVFGDPASPYVFNFSRYTSWQWDGNPLSNLATLRNAENWACDQLRIQKHLFLNDVLKRLGMDPVPNGQLVGWLFDESEGHQGDNFVDFGLCEGYASAHDEIMCDQDTLKKSIRLNFNCQGEIWDKI